MFIKGEKDGFFSHSPSPLLSLRLNLEREALQNFFFSDQQAHAGAVASHLRVVAPPPALYFFIFSKFFFEFYKSFFMLSSDPKLVFAKT